MGPVVRSLARFPARGERRCAEARAAYFDNEGHVIEYQASRSANGKTLTFVSSASPSGPRFRLVYKVLASDRLAVDFDIAPPGTETFRTYVAGTLERVRP